jgi:flagellar FliL protein
MAEEEKSKAAEGAESEETGEASGGDGRKKLILIAAACLLVLAGAGVGFVMLSGGVPEEGDEAIESADAVASTESEAPHPFDTATHETSEEVSAGGKDEHAGSDNAMVGTMYALDSFIVNIGDRDRDRYLKLKAELELSKAAVAEEIAQRLPQIRDLIISLLGSKSFDEVRSIEGKDLLREEVLHRINALLVTGKARSVFFTEFVVQ